MFILFIMYIWLTPLPPLGLAGETFSISHFGSERSLALFLFFFFFFCVFLLCFFNLKLLSSVRDNAQSFAPFGTGDTRRPEHRLINIDRSLNVSDQNGGSLNYQVIYMGCGGVISREVWFPIVPRSAPLRTGAPEHPSCSASCLAPPRWHGAEVWI